MLAGKEENIGFPPREVRSGLHLKRRGAYDPYLVRLHKVPKQSGEEVGKVLMVTGSTRDYLEVRLKSGIIGYVEPTAVELVKPADTSFMVTRDSPVYEKPNRFAKKVAEVVRGRPVKVTGVALDYVRIRLRSGVVGFLPMSALQ